MTTAAENSTTANSSAYMQSAPVRTVPRVAALYIQRSIVELRNERFSHSPLGKMTHTVMAITAVTPIIASRPRLIDAAICQMLA
jgi:hypothetical protein